LRGTTLGPANRGRRLDAAEHYVLADTTNRLLCAMGFGAIGHDAGNAHYRAQSCGATGRDDLHVLQISRLQAQLIRARP
jgi:hypothetical protein